MHLLDTNTCVYAIRRRPPAVFERLAKADVDEVALSVVTAFELQVGAVRASGQRYSTMVEEFLAEFPLLPLEPEVRRVYALQRVALERIGQMIGPLDMLIAAHALTLDATLVTNNVREFRRVKDLRIENWIG